MRIIGGKFKGRKISNTSSFTTRPLRDFVKENIFNLICYGKEVGISLNRANVLDVYSGTGSFGIECVSRHADKVVFVERDADSYKILKKNVDHLKLNKYAELVNLNIENYIKNFKSSFKFDIIFLDPPYKDESYIDIIKLIKKREIFKSEHIIIVHRERKCEEKLNDHLNIKFQKNYGRSKIIFGYF